MICTCFEGTPCELEIELLQKLEEARCRFENFPGPGSRVAVEQAENPLFEHRRDVQHSLYGAILQASEWLEECEKEIPRREARIRLQALQRIYKEAKLATRDVAPWTRRERLTLTEETA